MGVLYTLKIDNLGREGYYLDSKFPCLEGSP